MRPILRFVAIVTAGAALAIGGWAPSGIAAAAVSLDRAAAPDTSAPSQTRSLTVLVEPDVLTVGAATTVGLQGWPAGPAQIEICGNVARRGSIDCDRVGAVTVPVAEDGSSSITLNVGSPPSACPCVVRVSQTHSAATATVPIELDCVAPPATVAVSEAAAPDRRVEIVDVTVADDEGLGSWFGLDTGRRVVVTVRNAGGVRLQDVSVSARLLGGLDTTTLIDSPAPFDLEPGESEAVALDVTLPAPAFGDYRIAGYVDGGDRRQEFSASTSHMPWGLINGVVLAIAATVVVKRRRRATPS